MLRLSGIQQQHEDTWQSELSLAYVLAVASTAGVACEFARVDIFGVDAMLRTDVTGARDPEPYLKVQIKSWSTPDEHAGYFRYPLKVKNYNRLIPHSKIPAILVLVVMPPSMEDWFSGTDEQATIRHCAYWKSLEGEPPSDNRSTETVYVPKENQFSVEALTKMMTRIADGGRP